MAGGVNSAARTASTERGTSNCANTAAAALGTAAGVSNLVNSNIAKSALQQIQALLYILVLLYYFNNSQCRCYMQQQNNLLTNYIMNMNSALCNQVLCMNNNCMNNNSSIR